MRTIIAAISLFVISTIAFILLSSSVFLKTSKVETLSKKPVQAISFNSYKKLQVKALEAKMFAKKNNYNSNFCFLIDMSIPSDKKRFFIYDIKKDSIQISGLVTHGNCNEYWLQGRKYSNEVGCGCTSLGKYKIGNAYKGRFGLAFKLYGLEKTNNNAFDRYVVLHSNSCVPEGEVETDICQSNGCPTVSPIFLKQLEPIIKNSKKPVLLWIFD